MLDQVMTLLRDAWAARETTIAGRSLWELVQPTLIMANIFQLVGYLTTLTWPVLRVRAFTKVGAQLVSTGLSALILINVATLMLLIVAPVGDQMGIAVAVLSLVFIGATWLQVGFKGKMTLVRFVLNAAVPLGGAGLVSGFFQQLFAG